MAVLTADLTKGDLTGSGTQDIIATAAAGSAQETWSVVFRNRSGSTVTVKFFLNGTTSTDQFGIVSLLTLEYCVVTLSLGPSDVLRAEASAATSVAWFCTKGILT